MLIPPPISFFINGVDKSYFGIPNKFTFLYIYDKNSISERKNPLGLINNFLSAFSNNNDVCLVIKTNDSEINKFAIENKIIILNKTFERQEIYELQNCADCFISPHRSEGFGLNIAESMFLEKTIITTGWSGNTDFTNDENSFLIDYKLEYLKEKYEPYTTNDRWAIIDNDHCIELMKYVVNNNTSIKGINAKKTIKEKYSTYKICQLIEDRLK